MVTVRNGFVLPTSGRKGIVTDTEIEARDLDLPEPRGSRRGPERREAICDAVFEVLGEVGYDRLTMVAVATRAPVKPATWCWCIRTKRT